MRLLRFLCGALLLIGSSACTFGPSGPDKVPACQGSVVKGCSPTVYFLFDSDVISPRGEKRLDWAVKKLSRYPKKRVLVAAHTDQTGPQKYNMNLSLRRAKNAKKYLVSKGIDADRIGFAIFGPTRPVCSDYSGCAQLNRRIVLTIK